MFWLLVACLSRISFALCNILDGHFRNGTFKNSITQTFYFGTYLFFLTVIYYILNPVELLSYELMLWSCIAGFCLALHGIPYLSALKDADTSTVVSLFTLGRVFAPLLSVLFVNEVLSLSEIIGFLITLGGSLWHAYKPKQGRLDLTLVLKMMFSGLMVAGFSVASKKVFLEASVESGLFYIYVFDALCSLSTILIPHYTRDIIDTMRKPGLRIPYTSVVICALLGHTLSFYAISLTKVTYVVLVGQFQAFFALMISFVVCRIKSLKHRESFEIEDVSQKLIGFGIMAIGACVTLAW